MNESSVTTNTSERTHPEPVDSLLDKLKTSLEGASIDVASPEREDAPYRIALSLKQRTCAVTWDRLFGFVDEESHVRFTEEGEVLRHVRFVLAADDEAPSILALVDPKPGTILSPGDYLVEMGSDLRISNEDLLVALAMIGFGEVRLDESLKSGDEERSEPWTLWSEPETPLTTRHRFIARLEETAQIQEHPHLRWLYIQGISLDPFADTAFEVPLRRLKRGQLYEVRFVARPPQAKAGESRKRHREVAFDKLSTLTGLSINGTPNPSFDIMKLSSLKKHVRLKGQAGADVTLWYALARWIGPDGFVTGEEQLYFDSLSAVDLPPST